jgi:hypothetical protein
MKTIRKTSAAPNGEPPKKPPEYVKGSSNLVGMAFHVLNYKGHVHNQGYSIDRIGERHYLARFFDFLLGEPNAIQGFDIDEIFGRYRNGLPKFQLYTSVEAMKYEYHYLTVPDERISRIRFFTRELRSQRRKDMAWRGPRTTASRCKTRR